MKTGIIKILAIYLLIHHVQISTAEPTSISTDKKLIVKMPAQTNPIPNDKTKSVRNEDKLIKFIQQFIEKNETSSSKSTKQLVAEKNNHSNQTGYKTIIHEEPINILSKLSTIYNQTKSILNHISRFIAKINKTSSLSKGKLLSVYNENIMLEISRKLTFDEIQQINALPNRFDLNTYNIRIIDLDSILNGLKKYIGNKRVEYYKNLSLLENRDELLKKLRQFLEKQPFQEFSIDFFAYNASDIIPISADTKQKHDEYKKRDIGYLINMASELINNEPARHSLIVFMAMHKFRSFITKSMGNMNLLRTNESKKHMVRFYFAENMSCGAVPRTGHGSDIFLDFLIPNKYILSTLPEFSNDTKIDYFVGTSPFIDEKFTAMLHEFGHSWYIYFDELSRYKKKNTISTFEDFMQIKFLREIFPMCKNPLFYKKDLTDIIYNECNGYKPKFIKKYIENATAKLKRFHYENLENIKNLAILNGLAYHEIWSYPHEIAQVLGLDKFEDIILINRLSDFDYSVHEGVPFRAVYYCSNKNDLIKSPKEPYRLKIPYNIYNNSNLHTHILTKIKKLRDRGIETILPSEDALRALFVLHGKDLDVYRNKIYRNKSKLWNLFNL
jgi:hypothetical protein